MCMAQHKFRSKNNKDAFVKEIFVANILTNNVMLCTITTMLVEIRERFAFVYLKYQEKVKISDKINKKITVC